MPVTLRLLLVLALAGQALARAGQVFDEKDWAITTSFPVAPKSDDIRTPSDFGDVVVKRYFTEQAGARCMLARFLYPVVPLVREQDGLYGNSIEEMMRSRPGEMKAHSPVIIGAYTGRRIVLFHRREKSTREVRQVLIGAALYLLSAEWPGTGAPPPEIARFLDGAAVQPGFADPRVAEDEGRWRVLSHGNFSLRYDASRWYRDPSDTDPGVFNFLRVDKLAEAQLIAEHDPAQTDSMEASVLATARETAESVVLRKRGRKNRGGATVEELEFTARADGTTFVNHGYFYTGSAGAVQLRGWSPEKTYAQVSGDITELLDGLAVSPPNAALKADAAR